jgi:cysteine synthase
MVAAVRGYKIVCVVPEKMSHDKRASLTALAAQVIVTPNRAPDHPENFQNVVARLAHENG